LHLQSINPLKAELNPICHLLALLGAQPILHVSRIRVNYYYSDRHKDAFYITNSGKDIIHNASRTNSIWRQCNILGTFIANGSNRQPCSPSPPVY